MLVAWAMTWVLGGPVRVSGGAMVPAVLPGEVVWVWRGPALWGSGAKRGEVVVLESPVSSGQVLLRVAGVAGDTVRVASGAVKVNGKVVNTDFWAACGGAWGGASSSAMKVVGDAKTVHVPEGRVFVLGDAVAEEGAEDSRVFGSVPVGAVRGRAVTVVWPLMRRAAKVRCADARITTAARGALLQNVRVIGPAGERAAGIGKSAE